MSYEFKAAKKYGAKARVALIGPAGAGKTYSALAIAKVLAGNGKVAVIDTENGTASKYADLFTFDTLQLETFEPDTYVKAIHAAEEAGYAVVVIDSLSHAWMGKGGALEQVDAAARRSSSGNSFTAWRDVTPKHNAMVQALIACKAHLIVTMRAKMEYVQEKDDRGKTIIRKVGLAAIQRDGLEYEFDVVGDMDIDNNLVVSKSRCPALHGKVFNKPGEHPGKELVEWLSGDAPPAAPVVNEGFPPAGPIGKPAAKPAPAAPARPSNSTRADLEALDLKGLAERCYRAHGLDPIKEEVARLGGDMGVKAEKGFGLGTDGVKALREALIVRMTEGGN